MNRIFNNDSSKRSRPPRRAGISSEATRRPPSTMKSALYEGYSLRSSSKRPEGARKGPEQPSSSSRPTASRRAPSGEEEKGRENENPTATSSGSDDSAAPLSLTTSPLDHGVAPPHHSS